MSMEIKIKYFNKEMDPVAKHGDWIDLRAGETVKLKAGEYKAIPLGIAMELPEGCEAMVISRSSTFKNYGILHANGVSLIDEAYRGDNDEWFYPAFATRDTEIPFNERICQFRIQKKQPEFAFTEVSVLGNEDRGGHGSTGRK